MNLLWQQKLCNLQQLQDRRFHVPQPTFLFPMETPLLLSRNMLHEWKDNAVLAKPLAACTRLLSATVSQLFEPQVQTIAVFTYCSPHFCFTGDAPAIITQCVAWMERQFNACQTPRSMYLPIFNSFRVIRWLSQCVSPKIAVFTYRNPHFCFPWRRPCDYHAICCMDGKTYIIQCLPNPSQHVPIYLQ